MRYKIWESEDFFAQGPNDENRIDMDPSVVTLPTDGVPVVWQMQWDSTPVARIENIKLEDGEITGEVVWLDEQFNDQSIIDFGCRLGGYYAGVKKKAQEVTECRLTAVGIMFLSNTPGWPRHGENPGAKVE